MALTRRPSAGRAMHRPRRSSSRRQAPRVRADPPLRPRDWCQPDYGDHPISLLRVLAILWRDRRDAAIRLFALSAAQRLRVHLHLPLAHLEPDVIGVRDHVAQPRWVGLRPSLRGNDDPGILAL